MPKVSKKSAAVATATAPAAVKAAKKKGKKAVSREVIYPEFEVAVCTGDSAVTVDQAKDWLGWEVVPSDSEAEFLFKDLDGEKIRCTNNYGNRPYTSSLSHLYAQEILRGRWKLNGETMIIGKTGQTLACQHRLIGLVIAYQMWEADPDAYPFWGGHAPTMDALVVFGVDETDDTVNTIDTGKPRSLGDAIFRSEYFSSVKTSDRKLIAKVLDYAVRFVWHRTGLGTDAYAPRRTHSEAFDFIERHKTLLQCVKHIHGENEEGQISKIISPGTAAGLMYLMACSSIDPEVYRETSDPTEDLLTFEFLDQATEFWSAIAGNAPAFKPLRNAFAKMIEGNQGGSTPEKLAILVKAWLAFAIRGKFTDKDLNLEYHTDEDGQKMLMECPSVGGIDYGNPADQQSDDDPTPEEIAAEAEKIKADKKSKKAGNIIYLTPADLTDGDFVWVGEGEERWMGIFRSHYKLAAGPIAKVEACEGYDGEGQVYDTSFESLTVVDPSEMAGEDEPAD